jgi:hypothetical protein
VAALREARAVMLALDPQIPVEHDPFGTWLRPGCPCGDAQPKNASKDTATSDVEDALAVASRPSKPDSEWMGLTCKGGYIADV